MALFELPPFKHTLIDDIPSIVSRLRKTYSSQKTRPAEYRIRQLRQLYWAMVDNEKELLEALDRDLRKSTFETYAAEINFITNEIIFATQSLHQWMKDETPADIALMDKLLTPKIRKDPLGVVLITGPFNFPVHLSFSPMIGAIAAGNTVVLKPSEQCPNSAAVMQKIMETALDQDCYACVQGAVPETTALLDQHWDKIFFTGSARTARIVAQAAIKNLTPVALELGGRNPAIVSKHANIRLAARRLLWSKTMNAGQVCMSQNYILADRVVVPDLIQELRVAMKEFFPGGAKKSADFSRIVNINSFNRIKKMLDESSGKVVIGGALDAEELFIEPTVIEVTDPRDSVLVEESFGPLLPILPVDNLDHAISTANEIHETPLGIYAFGTLAETDKVLAGTRSGGASINDGLFHGIIPNLPFGGVGDSGSGSYRGRASFDCFTHRRSIIHTPSWMEPMLALRYPPFTNTTKLHRYNRMTLLKPDFDRNNNQKINIFWYLLTLGSGTAKSGAFRATMLAAVAFLLKRYTCGELRLRRIQ
ncbi:hypothetical protein LTR84_011982 [Exophiala bonariae]|uniref:Aldehyde dehydrogenase n=1 Tax=Exophiala bonariae TaxID=1690606 RepID=A0AAV9MRH1_9EURO|nr:hypothetical protein LTR84_011982 [Exophiala bonariae]